MYECVLYTCGNVVCTVCTCVVCTNKSVFLIKLIILSIHVEGTYISLDLDVDIQK